MDTSKTYIKMSDCEEIQALQTCLQLPNKINMVWWDSRGNCWFDKDGIKAIWLPRQDELQERVKTNNLPYDIGSFLRYCIANVFPHDTWEQLWLAFVMKERWNKIWVNGEWIEEK